MSAPEDELLFQIRAAGLPEPFREYRFAQALTGRGWRADFAWVNLYPALLVEVEGGGWSEGRHTRGKGFTEDMDKYNTAGELGFRVLRFTPQQVEDGSALARIERSLRGEYPIPLPAPYQRERIIPGPSLYSEGGPDDGPDLPIGDGGTNAV